MTARNVRALFEKLARERILVLDGAMGTMIQGYGLGENDYRGARFANHPHELKGDNELLVLSQPAIIKEIHAKYLEAGADILETNTFSSNALSQDDYHLSSVVYDLNVEAARLARAAADEWSDRTPDKPRLVAGALGPTTRTLSLSPDVSDPGFRTHTFDQMRDAYAEQARGLLDGGVDLLLLETITDTLNAKAAIYAVLELLEQRGIDVPIMISVTIVDQSGRTLS